MNKSQVLKSVIVMTGFAAASVAIAQEYGRVISSTPVYTAVSTPQQVCGNQTVYDRQEPSGLGAITGMIAGGAIGNRFGDGGGRAAATAIGAIGGAILGNHLETGNRQPQARVVQNCTTQYVTENQITAYNVVYEYAGRQYSMQTQQAPGAYVPLDIRPNLPINSAPSAPISGFGPGQVYGSPVTYAPPVYQKPHRGYWAHQKPYPRQPYGNDWHYAY